MLSLTRREKESIILKNLDTGEMTTITIYQIKHGEVKVNISAPKNINIIRDELINKENY